MSLFGLPVRRRSLPSPVYRMGHGPIDGVRLFLPHGGGIRPPAAMRCQLLRLKIATHFLPRLLWMGEPPKIIFYCMIFFADNRNLLKSPAFSAGLMFFGAFSEFQFLQRAGAMVS
jgi:hypothetical protein